MIQNNNEDWLNDLKEMVGGISDTAPEGAFEAIMASAAGARRRARARRTVALVAGLAAAAAVSTLFLIPKGAADAPQNEGCLIADNTVAAAVEAAVATAADDSWTAMQVVAATPAQLIAEAPSEVEASPAVPANSLPTAPAATSEPTADANPAAVQPEVSAAAAPSSAQPSAVEPETRPDRQNATQNVSHTVAADNAASLERYIASLDDEKPRRRKFTIALNSGSTAATERNSSYSVSLLFPKGTKIPNNEDDIYTTVIIPPHDNIPQSGNGSEITGFSFDIYEEKGKQVIAPQVIPEDKPVTEKEKYEERTASIGRSVSIPISAGITLSYDISPRFAIESGITLTLLSSTFSLDKRPVLSIDSYYAGIPLAVKAGIYETSHSDFYVRAGGMMEKCISSTEGGYYRNLIKADQINDGKMLWSAFGYAGYQYRINGFSSVYFEPGVSYHFDSDNMGYIIYEKTPCLFSLQAGLRFRL